MQKQTKKTMTEHIVQKIVFLFPEISYIIIFEDLSLVLGMCGRFLNDALVSIKIKSMEIVYKITFEKNNMKPNSLTSYRSFVCD